MNASANRQGRGLSHTFLSKSFINQLIKYLAVQIRMNIASEIKAASIFRIEVDATQGIAVIDKLAICVRYIIHDIINVKLLRRVAA